MTADDFAHIGQEMAASLAKSPALATRGPQSEPWTVSVDKVMNLTSDVMTEGEQWMIIARVRSSLPMQALRESKNVRFVIPPERRSALRTDPNLGRAVGDFDADFGKERQPTHLLNATFRSITRADDKGAGRVELYYCEFEILNLKAGEPTWTDKVEYKRAAVGHIWD